MGSVQCKLFCIRPPFLKSLTSVLETVNSFFQFGKKMLSSIDEVMSLNINVSVKGLLPPCLHTRNQISLFEIT